MERTKKDMDRTLNVAQEQEEERKLEYRKHEMEEKAFTDDFFIPNKKSGLDNKRLKDLEEKYQDSKCGKDKYTRKPAE